MLDRRTGTADRIAQLVAHRQALRASGADAAALERNRLEIVSLQHRLNRELLARYLPEASAA
jgi:hypothetical protein